MLAGTDHIVVRRSTREPALLRRLTSWSAAIHESSNDSCVVTIQKKCDRSHWCENMRSVRQPTNRLWCSGRSRPDGRASGQELGPPGRRHRERQRKMRFRHQRTRIRCPYRLQERSEGRHHRRTQEIPGCPEHAVRRTQFRQVGPDGRERRVSCRRIKRKRRCNCSAFYMARTESDQLRTTRLYSLVRVSISMTSPWLTNSGTWTV